MPQQPKMVQVKAKSQELKSRSRTWVEGFNYLSCHLMPSKVCISKNQESGVGARLVPRDSNMGCRYPKTVSEITVSNACPQKYSVVKQK